MPSDRGEPWAGATYNGFSGPGAPDPPPPPQSAPVWRSVPQISRKTMILGGVGAAVLAGLAFGLWARPPHDRLSSAAEAATPASVPIEVNRPQPLPTPKAAGRLEVLPTDMAQQARAGAPPARPRAETGLSEDVSAISPQIEDPPELADSPPPRWAPPEQRLSRAERRALREQRWNDEAPPPPVRAYPRPLPLDVPPPSEDDGDEGY